MTTPTFSLDAYRLRLALADALTGWTGTTYGDYRTWTRKGPNGVVRVVLEHATGRVRINAPGVADRYRRWTTRYYASVADALRTAGVL
ncbi:MAG: hypothetical protein ACRD0P_39055 [Stackebrandtia sp.]